MICQAGRHDRVPAAVLAAPRGLGRQPLRAPRHLPPRQTRPPQHPPLVGASCIGTPRPPAALQELTSLARGLCRARARAAAPGWGACCTSSISHTHLRYTEESAALRPALGRTHISLNHRLCRAMHARARALAGLLALVCALGAARPAAGATAAATDALPDADTVPCSQLPELAAHAQRVAILGRCRWAAAYRIRVCRPACGAAPPWRAPHPPAWVPAHLHTSLLASQPQHTASPTTPRHTGTPRAAP